MLLSTFISICPSACLGPSGLSPPSLPLLGRASRHLRIAPGARRLSRASGRTSIAPPRCSSRPSTPVSAVGDVPTLRVALVDAMDGLDRGFALDPESETETPAEALVEDLAEQLEDANECACPTRSPDMGGSWELIYTSSTIVRFAGGLTGLQKYLPDGSVGRIIQVVEPEDGTCVFTEQLTYTLPVVNKQVAMDVVVAGRIRATSETRQVWSPESVKASWFRSWAESWKTLGPFTIAETTYLDKYLRITRGQTGSMNIFARTQEI